ncbi:hypothetical protein ACC691_39605, partial [Rhizobium johnstonii]
LRRQVGEDLVDGPELQLGADLAENALGLEWYSGSWVGFDPTNGIDIGERHVLVGRGRDYSDVSPLRGVYAGSKASQLFVKVEITRE